MKKSLILFVSAALSLSAADFWGDVPAENWTDKQARKILTSSPWAHSVLVLIPGSAPALLNGGENKLPGGTLNPFGSNSATIREQRTTLGIGEEGDSRPTPALNSKREALLRPDVRLVGAKAMVTIRWESALPIRQALQHAAKGNQPAVPLPGDPLSYSIAVIDVTPDLAEFTTRQALAEGASMKLDRGPATKAKVMRVKQNGHNIDLHFEFAATPAQTVASQEAEFAFQIGPAIVRQRFHLKDMMYQGKPAL